MLKRLPDCVAFAHNCVNGGVLADRVKLQVAHDPIEWDRFDNVLAITESPDGSLWSGASKWPVVVKRMFMQLCGCSYALACGKSGFPEPNFAWSVWCGENLVLFTVVLNHAPRHVPCAICIPVTCSHFHDQWPLLDTRGIELLFDLPHYLG